MRIISLPIVTVVMAVFSLATQAHAQTALQLFDQAVKTVRERRAKLETMQYRAVVKSRQYDSEEKTTGKREQVFLVFPGGNPTSRLLSEKKSGRLSWLEEKEKADKEKESAPSIPGDQASEKTSQNPKKSSEADPETVAEAVDRYNLRERYQWTRLPDEKFAGTMARVITFVPRPRFPAKTSEERFCNLLSGKIWLSPIDGTILKGEATMNGVHKLFWVIATLQKLEFSYKIRGKDGPGIFDDSETKMILEIALPFYRVRQTHQLEVDSFSPRGN